MADGKPPVRELPRCLEQIIGQQAKVSLVGEPASRERRENLHSGGRGQAGLTQAVADEWLAGQSTNLCCRHQRQRPAALMDPGHDDVPSHLGACGSVDCRSVGL